MKIEEKAEEAPPAQLSPEEKRIEEIEKRLEEVIDKQSQEQREIEKKYSVEKIALNKERAEAIKAFPKFWSTTLKKHYLSSYLNEQDLEILDYLEDLWVEELYEFLEAFKITLTFKADNPYFSNATISKTFKFNKLREAYDVEATKIDWKADKNLAEQNKKVEALEEQEPAKQNPEEEGDELEYSWFGDWEAVGVEDEEDDEVAQFIREEVWNEPFKIYRALIIDEDDDEE